MSEYLIKGETLTSMADKVRVLSGAEGAMTPAQMDGNLGEVNADVSIEADLIAQITSALENKAISGNVSYDTCTVNLTAESTIYSVAYITVDDNGNITPTTAMTSSGSSSYSLTCLCNSFIMVSVGNLYEVSLTNAYMLVRPAQDCAVYSLMAGKGEIASISIHSTPSGPADGGSAN